MGDLTRKTVRNSIYGVVEFTWPILLSILAIPYIVMKLGTDVYGVLSLVTVVLGFFAVLDLGLTAASIKYIAEEYEKKDYKKINNIINSTLIVYFAMGAIGAATIFLSTDLLVTKILKMPEEIIGVTRFAFYIASLGLVINMILGVFASVPKSVQRFDISTKISIFIGTLTTITIVGLLYFGYGLSEIVLANLIISAISIVIYIMVTKRLLPQYRFYPKFDKQMFIKLFKFGSLYLFATISGLLVLHFDKFIIGSVLSISVVAFYVLPGNLAIKIQGFVSAIVNIVFPVSSSLIGQNQIEKIKKLYLKGTKIVLTITTMITVPLIIFSEKFLLYWLGPEFAEKSTVVMMVLAATYFLLSINGIGWNISYGMGKAKINATFSWIIAVINIGLLFFLIKPFGIIGVAVAYFISALITSPMVAIYIERKLLGMSGFEYWKLFFKIAIVGIFQAVISLGLVVFASNFIFTIFLMGVSCIAFIVIYVIFGYFDNDDKEILKLLFPRLKIFKNI